jgi:hypothetical protein
VISSAIAAMLLGATIVPSAHAVLSSTVIPCQEGLAKAGLKFVGKKLKDIQKCREKNMKAPGSCDTNALNTSISDLVTKLAGDINKKCAPPFPAAGLSNSPPSGIGFPGKCTQGAPGNFTSTDLVNCITESHENAIDGGNAVTAGADSLIDIEWGTTTANSNSANQKCQQAIDKNGGKVFSAVLKAVQKCRNAINKGTLTGVTPANCATADSKTNATITKAQSKASAGITGKCLDGDITALDVCNPNATTAAGAAACIVSTHTLAADNSAVTASDMIDFEYATPAVCGDGAKNQLTEECDGSDDSACPGQCGAANGDFPCLCLNIPRERVIEHQNSDLDNGWDGSAHDAGTVEGGGYVVNLYDCDSSGNCGDHTCNVGASCTGAPHDACTTNAQCNFLAEGTCRTDRTDVGPHCFLNVQTVCTTNADCTGAGNFCVKTFHGPPLPLSAGGISVCVLNIFSENVVGTKDTATGQASVRVRQRSQTHLTSEVGSNGPCPVCGGFCNGVTGDRHPCSVDADCSDVASHTCNHSAVCNFGPNADKACRANPPYGGGTTLFGNPSVDCPPPPPDNLTGVGLDILFNPSTTQTVQFLPTVQCDDAAFTGKTCAGGTNAGATCVVNSQCPGSIGGCSFQCYCPNGGAIHQKPNSCDAACVGGANDSTPCSVNSECPSGFCHLGDCRPDPTAPALLQPNEGACTATVEGHCSVSAFRSCNADADCQFPACPACHPSETCHITGKNCFINSDSLPGGIVRTGVPDTVNPVSASTFCIAQTNNGSVDATSGLPGPGALIQPTTVDDTGLTICP